MNIFKIFKKLLLVSLITTFFIMQLGCSKKKNSQTAQSKSPEEALCSLTTQTGLVVTGVASYEQMLPKISGGLSIPISKPIRRAEVMILKIAGAIIQCGETDSNGNYSLITELNCTSKWIFPEKILVLSGEVESQFILNRHFTMTSREDLTLEYKEAKQVHL